MESEDTLVAPSGLQISQNATGVTQPLNYRSSNNSSGRNDLGPNMQSSVFIDNGLLPATSPQESEHKASKVAARRDLYLEKTLFGDCVQECPVDPAIIVSDEAKQILEEMKLYEQEKKTIRTQQEYLDPLVFWGAKAGVYPCLFHLGLKMMSVPATSVLSE